MQGFYKAHLLWILRLWSRPGGCSKAIGTSATTIMTKFSIMHDLLGVVATRRYTLSRARTTTQIKTHENDDQVLLGPGMPLATVMTKFFWWRFATRRYTLPWASLGYVQTETTPLAWKHGMNGEKGHSPSICAIGLNSPWLEAGCLTWPTCSMAYERLIGFRDVVRQGMAYVMCRNLVLYIIDIFEFEIFSEPTFYKLLWIKRRY